MSSRTLPLPTRLTFAYKTLDGTSLFLDVYPPQHAGDISIDETIAHIDAATSSKSNHKTPATETFYRRHPVIMYFHGGGLTVGNKDSWFPHWLHRCVFVSIEYRLLPPSTGHDVVEDVKDAVHFVTHDLNALLAQTTASPPFQIEHERVAVVGTSSGGLCAYLAAVHATPKPKAVLSMYGMGGDMLTPHYFIPKTAVFFRGRELLDPDRFSQFLHPSCQDLSITSNSALEYLPQGSTMPGYPANPRMQLARLYLQMGTYLDYYTGSHAPSLSAALRNVAPDSGDTPYDGLISRIASEHRPLFPQLSVLSAWPPTFLVHGTADTAVLPSESMRLHASLQRAGVKVTLRLTEGKEHSFDYAPRAEEEFGVEGGLFDEAVGFLVGELGLALHLGGS